MGVAVNPIIYGVMRKSYRRGYWVIMKWVIYYGSCSFLKKQSGMMSTICR